MGILSHGVCGGLGVLSPLCCRSPAWGRSFALTRAFGEEPLEEMKRLKVAHSYEIAEFPDYRFLTVNGSCGASYGSGSVADTIDGSTVDPEAAISDGGSAA